MNKIIAFVSLLLISLDLTAQEENWDVYLAEYEKGPGSTVLNMALKTTAPDKNLPFLFSVRLNITNCRPDGFPASDEFAKLNRVSDSVIATLNRLVKNTTAGTFTYQCERREYFYVADTSNLREAIASLLSIHFPYYLFTFSIKEDKNWEAYLDFLYPNEETIEYMKNEKVLTHIKKQGDNLDKERQVDHWLYFKSENDRNCFIEYAKQSKFKIESKSKETDIKLPYKLQISREDKINLSAISKITLELERQAKKCNGDYDGWETFVVR